MNTQTKQAIVVADMQDCVQGRTNIDKIFNHPNVSAVVMTGQYWWAGEQVAVTAIVSKKDIVKNRDHIDGIFAETRAKVPHFRTANWIAEAYIPCGTPADIRMPQQSTDTRLAGFRHMLVNTGLQAQIDRHSTKAA
jgi:hypothetical protein